MLKLNVGLKIGETNTDRAFRQAMSGLNAGADVISLVSISGERDADILLAKRIARELGPNKRVAICPIYYAAQYDETIRRCVERHLDVGVSMFTFHATPFWLLQKARARGFTINSRGGEMLLRLLDGGAYVENPILTEWPRLVELEQEANRKSCDQILYSFGTSLRPGFCGADWSLQMEEIDDLNVRGMRSGRGDGFGYERTIEVGGHVFGVDIPRYVEDLNKVLVFGSTRYPSICLMGPMVTDGLNGRDDVTAMVGYVRFSEKFGREPDVQLVTTAAEHVRVPTAEDDVEGIKKAKMARHLYEATVTGGHAISESVRIAKLAHESKKCSAGANVLGERWSNSECEMCGDACPLRRIN
jgi:thiamine biosynthesis protein ThiC